jgi:hypothetical protein
VTRTGIGGGRKAAYYLGTPSGAVKVKKLMFELLDLRSS